MDGKIYLVDAGPGDPGLMTIKGLEVIRTADYIVYDHEVSPRLLSYARIDVERKEARSFSTEDHIMHELILKATDGKVVCRLQSDDSTHSFFSVGQSDVLKTSGISVEIIPGVSAATAFPVYAGTSLSSYYSTLPLILLNRNQMIQEVDWKMIANTRFPLLFQVQSQEITFILQNLLDAGYPSFSTGMLILEGTKVNQQTLTGTLTELRQKTLFLTPYLSAVLLIGEMVSERLTWFEQKPLFGCRILVTRARSQSSTMMKRIEDLGGEPIEMPMIQTVMPTDTSQIDLVLQRVAQFDWIVLTSVNGVEFFFQRLRELRIDLRKIGQAKIAAVGPKTVEAIEAKGLQVDLIPSTYQAEDLVEEMTRLVQPGEKILLPRGDLAREILPIELRKAGCEVTEVDIYQTKLDTGDAEKIAQYLEQGYLHIITFASSSTVKNFVEVMKSVRPNLQTLLSSTKLACIGPVTADTATDLGLQVDMVADPYTVDGLIDAIIKVARTT